MNRKLAIVTIIFLIVATARGAHATASDDADTRAAEGTLVLGCVTDNAKYNYGRVQGIADYVREKMADVGVKRVEVITVDSNQDMKRLLRDGQVDWVSATPFGAIQYIDEGDGELLVAKEQRGKRRYRSVFFARNDSPIEKLADLRGKTIAFEKVDSTSAYFIPATMLRKAGLRLVELDSPREIPPADAVGFVFSGSEANSSIWVHKGIVDAAAFSDGDWNSEFYMPDQFRNDLRIFAQSADFPRGVEIVRAKLDDKIKQRLAAVLVAASNDSDAVPALKNYYHATAFYPVDAALREALESIRIDVDFLRFTQTD